MRENSATHQSNPAIDEMRERIAVSIRRLERALEAGDTEQLKPIVNLLDEQMRRRDDMIAGRPSRTARALEHASTAIVGDPYLTARDLVEIRERFDEFSDLLEVAEAQAAGLPLAE